MYEYVHGGDIYSLQQKKKENILDFSVNTNPLGMPEAVKQAIVDAMPDCGRYPDPFCRELTSALAVYEKIDPHFILCGNGAADLIFRLALALRPKKALLCAPTFADYEKALKTVGCLVDYYPLWEEKEFNVESNFIQRITEETDMIYFCNPNNPTGQLASQSFMQDVLERCKEKNTVLVVDECFMDFVDDPLQYSVQPFIRSYRNLVILKAFTKIYSIPGIRLGYCITSNERLIEKMKQSGQDWGVSSLAQAAGISALVQTEYIQQTKRLIPVEREFLINELTKLKLKTFGSKANYIFFKTPAILDLHQRLLEKGIMIRSCSNYKNLNHEYYRIGIKIRRDNLKLIEALKEVL